ncbi:MAG: zf-HC2 domain-containing protein, partial [Nanoarchaeota archaeon]
MECKEVKEILSEYIDGRCGTGAKESVRTHLLKCKECFQELSKLKDTISMLKDLQPEEIPGKFYYGLDKKMDFVDMPFLEKVKLIFNLRNMSVALAGVL